MNIIDIFKLEQKVKKYQEIITNNQYDLLVSNTSPNHNYLLTLLTFLETDSFVFYITSNLYQATKAYENLCELAGYENVVFYVTEEIVAAELLAISREFKFERLHAINAIINNEKKIIVTHITAVTRLLLPLEEIKSHILEFEVGKNIDHETIIKKLVASGYKKVPLTSDVGEFSIRGEIIDIYPINSDKPYRIDLFDDEIDYIKTFDPETQLSINKINSCKVYPINELIYSDPEKIILQIKAKCSNIDMFEKDLEDIRNYNNLERLQKYINYFTDSPQIILNYLDEKIVIYEEIKRIEENYNKTIYELHEFLKSRDIPEGLNLRYFSDFYDIYHKVDKKIFLNVFKQTLNIKLTNILDIDGYEVVDYQNDIKNFIEDLKANPKKTFIILFSSFDKLGLMEEILNSNNINVNICNNIRELKTSHVNLIICDNPIGFGFINSIEVLSENNIFKKMRYRKAKYRSAFQNTVPITTKDDLQPGDFVVHFDYGIGRYLGIKTVTLQDIKNDYIMLQYENMELYIPVENINLLEKYQGTEGSVPKLTSVGTKEWEKRKNRIKKKLESIARELIETQALREEQKGFVYEPDNEIQIQFENDFEFIETPDQIKTTAEIKKDMENGVIVDRLVCGDVGYGKTEIAMRIAMKTVLNGKQVAYLAPTTILSRQHYYTFKERFERYGVRVGLLNRLVPQSAQSEIIKGLKTGDVDIVIGTHRLLNDEIFYRDLGLLIVDEEQRFGVVHKEKIKKLKHNVNVLTLTATPIPRTLQMAIMGVRQLSLIETPPQNRYPVQTYVLEENDTIIREAIYREISRGGQVFYLHNRISDLDKVYRRLKRLVPEAGILRAHGRMDKDELEDAIQAFIDYEYDVLLCTTIIETGIDIPNTNTLIVDMADRLGLAQMYQIRGRVGRSNRVSYAYFMYEENKVLTEAGGKRLNAIKEFTTLGSGYKIAVRDLAIRGAGDILGREQSGFIDSIGLDMYMKLLSEAINKLKGTQTETKLQKKSYNVEVSKHVSNTYVSDDDIKIYIHREIASIDNREEKERVVAELTDRFGKLTTEIKLYIEEKYMESLLAKLDVVEIKEANKIVEIIFSEKTSAIIDGSILFRKAYEISKKFSFEYKHKRIHMYLDKEKNDKTWIRKIIRLLERLVYN
ncbi:MAG TPA: transcription-repair coupling factor [Acholeplasmataceae bacterium]|nr:transcription-repair coupling factor [Acholeplasmataceae bacterium]